MSVFEGGTREVKSLKTTNFATHNNGGVETLNDIRPFNAPG